MSPEPAYQMTPETTQIIEIRQLSLRFSNCLRQHPPPSFAAVRPARGAGSALFGISGSARLHTSSVTMFSSQQLYVSDQDQPCIAFVAGPAAFWLPHLQAATHRLGPSHPPPQCCSVFLLIFHMKGPADFRPPHRARLAPVMYHCIFFVIT